MISALWHIALWCHLPAICQAPTTQSDERIDARVRTLIKAQLSMAGCELERASHALFLAATPDELNRLVAHSHPGVSLGAAWERVRRTVPQKTPKDKGKDIPDKEMLGRFLGVVEGRTQVVPPAFWERSVRFATSAERAFLFSTPEADAFFTGELEQDPFPPHPDYHCSGDTCVVVVGSSRWSLPREDNRSDGHATVLSKPQIDYLALHDSAYGRYSLYALNKTGALKWKARVAGAVIFKCGSGGGLSGLHPYDVELRARDDAVIVFGTSGPSVYIEAFNSTTGENLYRFCTGYLEHEEQ